ncbi:TPA: hypothetical protein WLH72_001191 [Neisseria gonorrhoeae]
MTNLEIAVLSGMTGFEIAVLSDGFRDYGVVGTQPNRHSRLRGNDGFRDCGVVGNDGKWRELCKKCRLKPLEAS